MRDDPEGQRYVVELDGEQVGMITYRLDGDVVVMNHTEVDPAHERQGIGSELVRQALEDVRRSGRRVRPVCPFVAAYIRRHPGDAELVG